MIDYDDRIFRAMNHISRNIERALSLEEIAGSASLSPFHFHRIFKAVVGENVAEFTRRLRLELAAGRLLSFPGLDITSVALSCGFSSSQNFAKAFKQRYSVTPTQYRGDMVNHELGSSPPTRYAASPPDFTAPTRYPRRGTPRRRPISIPASPPSVTPPTREKSAVTGGPGTGNLPIAVSVREMPVRRAATLRLIGPYEKTCPAAFAKLMTWARGRVVPGPGTLLAFYWDNPEVTAIDRCRFDCCLLIPDDVTPDAPVFVQNVGGGLWAFCRFETKQEGIPKAWDYSFRWLVASGRECRPEPCCEIYHNDAGQHPEGKWVLDIAIPL